MCGRKALKFICSLGIAVFLAGAICTIVGVTKLPTALPDNYYATRPPAVNITQDLQTYRYQSYGFYLIIIGCSVAGGGILCCAYTCLVPCCQRTKPKIGAVSAVPAVPSKTARKAVVDVGQPKDKPAPAGAKAEAETSTTIVRFSEPSPAILIHSDADPVEQLEDYDGVLFYKSTITLPFRFRHSVLINMNNQERITYIKRIHSWLGATAVQYYRVDFD
jgi:hypothetical protein